MFVVYVPAWQCPQLYMIPTLARCDCWPLHTHEPTRSVSLVRGTDGRLGLWRPSQRYEMQK